MTTTRAHAPGWQPRGRMNQTERRYAQLLDTRKAAGELLGWWFEALRLRIATDNAFYTPDFLVQLTSGAVELHEVKGTWKAQGQEAALVRTKVAASLYPFPVLVAMPRPAKQGGGWQIIEVTP